MVALSFVTKTLGEPEPRRSTRNVRTVAMLRHTALYAGTDIDTHGARSMSNAAYSGIRVAHPDALRAMRLLYLQTRKSIQSYALVS